MQFFDYEIEHRARYPWQFVQGKSCTLRLRCNEPVLKITVLHGDPFWFAEGEEGACFGRNRSFLKTALAG